MENPKINILDKWQYVLPFIQKLIPTDIAIGLADREKYLLYLPGKNFDLKINVSEYIKPDSSISRAMIEGREIHIRIDKEIFGQEYFVSALPIYDDYNNIIGAVAISTSTQIQDLVKQISSEIYRALI